MSSLFITCLWGGEDTPGGPTGPPPMVEGTDPLWLWSKSVTINNVFSKYEKSHAGEREPVAETITYLVLEEDGITMLQLEEGNGTIILEESIV